MSPSFKSCRATSYIIKLFNTFWLSPGNFFQGVGKIYCYGNFYCYSIVFGPNFREGQKFSRGENCLRGAPPLRESQLLSRDKDVLSHGTLFCNQFINYLLTGFPGRIENTKPSVTSHGPHFVGPYCVFYQYGQGNQLIN